MPAGLQEYPSGINAWLLIFFHDPASVVVDGMLQAIPADTLVLWAPRSPETYGNPSHSWCHSWLHVDGSHATRFLRQNQFHAGRPILLSASTSFVRMLLAIYDEFSSWRTPDGRVLQNLFEIGLINIAREGASPPRPDQALLRVKRRIDSQPALQLSLMQMAQEANLSVSHFCARFREVFGESPGRYLIVRRMERARHLLRTQRLSISEIAEQVGYPDAFHFSRMFRRETGMSPRAWRDNNRASS